MTLMINSCSIHGNYMLTQLCPHVSKFQKILGVFRRHDQLKRPIFRVLWSGI